MVNTPFCWPKIEAIGEWLSNRLSRGQDSKRSPLDFVHLTSSPLFCSSFHRTLSRFLSGIESGLCQLVLVQAKTSPHRGLQTRKYLLVESDLIPESELQSRSLTHPCTTKRVRMSLYVCLSVSSLTGATKPIWIADNEQNTLKANRHKINKICYGMCGISELTTNGQWILFP